MSKSVGHVVGLVLWSGLVSQVNASYRVNLIPPFPLGYNCLRKITMTMTMFDTGKILSCSGIVTLMVRTFDLLANELMTSLQ